MNVEKGNAKELNDATVTRRGGMSEQAVAEGRYVFECVGPKEHLRPMYSKLKRQAKALRNASIFRKAWLWLTGVSVAAELARLKAEMAGMTELKWADDIQNLVTTVGKNFALDTVLEGSAYTAAWYLGLISSVSYTAVAAGDTMASHGGWTEAGPTNAPNYDEATREAVSFGAAAAGSKATDVPCSFTIASAGTVKGAFLTTGSAKDGATGTLYSAGLFSGGDKVVGIDDTLNVSYTASL